MINEYDSKTEAESDAISRDDGPAYVKMWLDAIRLADDEEKEWRKKAEEAVKIYRADEDNGSAFNILHSNIETLSPALYNSTPVPDVRRRYGDKDPIGKVVGDIIERALSYSIDTYDFDSVMRGIVRDGELAGRGILRVRYVPHFAPMEEAEPVAEDSPGEQDDSPIPGEQVAYEEVTCDYVPWQYYRRGPGRQWKDIPWHAFCDFLTKEELYKLCGNAIDKSGKPVAEQVPMNYSVDKKGDMAEAKMQESTLFRRAKVWQIWDRDTRRVISICPDYMSAPLAVVDDPLELEQFFPIPRPYQPIITTDSLVPVVPYEIYKPHVIELNDVTRRIYKLVKQMRVRGGYSSDNPGDLKSISEADDGELVPLQGVAHLIDGGGIDKAITWFPIERIPPVLQVLIQQREAVKQTIYEVTGLADILRGATNPNETLGAQQLKAQWGGLRIQERQSEVARVARDVFRLQAEIIANKFSWQTITQMTGMQIPTAQQKQMAMAAMQAGQQLPPEIQEAMQQPTQEEIEPVLRTDMMRSYRVDIESDSTIRGDLSRNQATMTQFLQGTAQFIQSMAPVIQAYPQSIPAIVEIYSAFSRQFKLGRQAESALEGLITDAQNAAKQQQQPPPPDPRIEVDKQKLGIEQQRLELERQKMESGHSLERDRMAFDQMHQQNMLNETIAAREQGRKDALLPEREAMVNDFSGLIPQLVAAVTQSQNQTAQQVAAAQAQTAQALMASHAQNADAINQLSVAIAGMGERIAAPTEIVRGPDGRAIGARKVAPQRLM